VFVEWLWCVFISFVAVCDVFVCAHCGCVFVCAWPVCVCVREIILCVLFS